MNPLMIQIIGTLRQVAPPSWVARTLPRSDAWWRIVYGNGVFMAIAASSSAVAVSSDYGVTWQERGTLPFAANGLAFGDGVWVATDYTTTGKYALSSDYGLTWTTGVLAAGKQFFTVGYGGGKFVAAAGGTQDAYVSSNDGGTWTQYSTMGAGLTWYDIAYGSGVFAAIAGEVTTPFTTTSMATSSDNGATWTIRTLPSAQRWDAVAAHSGTFVAISVASSSAAVSTDSGVTWGASTLPASGSWNEIAVSDSGMWVTVASDVANSAQSTNSGTSWSSIAMPSASAWYGVAYGNGTFVAIANASTAAATLKIAEPSGVALFMYGALPSATVGTAWTGVLYFGGDYTGTLTVGTDSGTIPTWMGSPTIDYGAKTITWTGTPASGDVGTDNFTPKITDSASQVAVGPAQSVVVSAAPASPVPVHQQYGRYTGGTSQTMTFASAPTAGNTMLIAMAGGATDGPATPSGWTAVDDVAINGSSRHWHWFKRTSDGTETGVTVTWGGQHTFNSFAYQEWEGDVTFSGGESTYINGPSTAPTITTAAPPDANAVPAMNVFCSSANTSLAIASPWAASLPPNNSQNADANVPATREATGAAVTLPITWASAPSFIYWANIWVSKV